MTYTKRMLAVRYYPNCRNLKSAMAHFRRDIDRCPSLTQALSQTGYRRGQNAFSVRQANLVFDHLGEPQIN